MGQQEKQRALPYRYSTMERTEHDAVNGQTRQRPRWRQALSVLGGVALAAYVVLFIVGLWFSDRCIFFPPQPPEYSATQPGLRFIPMTTGERIAAIYLPNPDARYTLLYSHGNGNDLGDGQVVAAQLHAMGFAVLAYDYPGYGHSDGQPSEEGCYRAIDAAYAYLTETLRIPADRIIIFGHSLGGGPSADLAARKPAAGLVLESTFTTAFRVSTGVRVLPFDKFNSLAKLSRVRCPVLVIHGTRDTVIPPWHGQALYRQANQPKFSYWVAGADHNDLIDVGGEAYADRLRAFAASLSR
jgi:fermentation-respiration switch protein FrsA (DUF1100 family)